MDAKMIADELMKAEEERNVGKPGYTIEELDRILSRVIEKSSDEE